MKRATVFCMAALALLLVTGPVEAQNRRAR